MKALLYKDFVTLWKYLRNYLLMCVIFQLASLAGSDFEFMRDYPLILGPRCPTRCWPTMSAAAGKNMP